MVENKYLYKIRYNGRKQRLFITDDYSHVQGYFLKNGGDLASMLFGKSSKVLAVGGLLRKVGELYDICLLGQDPDDMISYELGLANGNIIYLGGHPKKEVKHIMPSEEDFLRAITKAQARRQNRQ